MSQPGVEKEPHVYNINNRLYTHKRKPKEITGEDHAFAMPFVRRYRESQGESAKDVAREKRTTWEDYEIYYFHIWAFRGLVQPVPDAAEPVKSSSTFFSADKTEDTFYTSNSRGGHGYYNGGQQPRALKRPFGKQLTREKEKNSELEEVYHEEFKQGMRKGLQDGKFGIHELLAAKVAKLSTPALSSGPCAYHSVLRKDYLLDGICVDHKGMPCNASHKLGPADQQWYSKAWADKQLERAKILNEKEKKAADPE